MEGRLLVVIVVVEVEVRRRFHFFGLGDVFGSRVICFLLVEMR